jgi:hypothetical protein
MSAIPLWQFDVDYSLKADAFIAGGMVAVVSSYLVVRRPRPAHAASPSRAKSDLSFARCLAVVGLIGNAFLLVTAVQNGVSIGLETLTGGGLAQIRESSFEAAAIGGASGLSVLGSLLAPAGYLYLAAAPMLPWRERRSVRVLAYMNFVGIVLVALFLYAGRQSIIIALILVAVGIWLRGLRVFRVTPRRVAIAVVFLVAGFYFVSTFAQDREKQGAASVDYQLHVVSHAQFAPWIHQAANENRALGAALFQLSYFGSPLPSFSYYVQQDIPGPLYGKYSYPQVLAFARRIDENGPYSEKWADVRAEVFAPYEKRGYFGNVWPTMARDVLVDWGFIGGLFFFALMGAFAAWARNTFERSGAVFVHTLEVYAITVLAFGAFQSLIYPDFVAVGFFIALAFVGAQALWLGASKARD